MNKDQVKEVPADADDLPEIRFPVRGSINATEISAQQDDVEKLRKLVEASFNTISSETGLSDIEVLRMVKDTDVEMLKDVLKDDNEVDELKDGIDVDKLREGIQEAIKKISLATGLETVLISDIFTEKKDDNLEGIVHRLYYKGQAVRQRFGN